MSAPTIIVKLRDRRTSPPITQEFTLPLTRLIQTSAYFRHHLAESISRHRDGIFRLNYPDFELFEVYVEWLRSGEVFTRAGLQHLRSPHRSPGRKTDEEKARAAYTDYLGLWFLGSWVQDNTFKNGIISRIIDKMNAKGGEGYPQEFVRALKPSLVDIVFAGSKEGDPIRRLMFAAITRFAEEEDVSKFLPGEGKDEYPKKFVRELMVFLFSLQRGAHSDGRGAHTDSITDTETSVSDFTSTTSSVTEDFCMPPPFASPTRDSFSFASHVSWPSTTFSDQTRSSVQHSRNASGNTQSTATSVTPTSAAFVHANKRYLSWPKSLQEHCFFHEHG